MIANGREIIRAGYAAGRPLKDIARDCESTPGSVAVTAHNMGLRQRWFVAERVPEHLISDYRHIARKKDCGAKYACRVLGLPYLPYTRGKDSQ